jgi:hypothetical protein
VNKTESWAAYDFEMHARKCAYCHKPYEVHRNHEQLCDVGHRLAQEVARYIYNKSNGETYSTVQEDHKLVRVEIPSAYEEVRGLLRAIERSLRHRTRTPFVSMDRTYYVSTRAPMPDRTRSVKLEQAARKPRPKSGEIVDWPDRESVIKPVARPVTKVTTEINSSVDNKRGSLYQSDLAELKRNAQKYKVEVREPSSYDRRERRSSGYYR